MYAPRAKFERIYIVSPVKVAIIFLTMLHCLFLLIASLTSFWIRTNRGHYGPLYSCEKQLDWTKPSAYPITIKCNIDQWLHDKNLKWMPVTAVLILFSFAMAFISIIIATLSFVKNSFTIRRRYWLCTIILLLLVFLIDCFIIIFIPMIHRHQVYHLQWAYGVHCGATLFISACLVTAILTHNTDDIQYVEAVDESSVDKS